ncbi:unnamed protein product [Rotaria magnacalcarata]|uniref:F-box domain-containing protein n=1 Tax=Rotaria magnacalcarata TaxID=392030 RepID=A0A8S2QX03_9BILA|nr:unnamed protein product [Rotaria magnacalcarata]
MIFEFLPSEILIECFTYLNAFDLFYSFDELNSRLNNLIRNVRLYINFEDVNKAIFDKFCAKMLIDSNIQNQIHSIEILNDDECFQCNLFLSSFPPNKFPNLQRFIWTPPLLPDNEYALEYQKSYFNDQNIHLKIKQSDLPLSQLRALSILNIAPFISDLHQNSIINNLKISTFHLKDSECLCNNVPMLKYLHIKFMNRIYEKITNIFSNHQHRFHLKQLIIDQFNDTFENFEMFVKQTPNLKSLTFISDNNNDINIIDANRWEYLIVSSIPKLHDTENLFVIIDNLPKLSTLKIKHQSKFEPEETFLEFKNEASKRDIPYDINFYNLTDAHYWYASRLGHDWFVTKLFIWIGSKHTLD